MIAFMHLAYQQERKSSILNINAAGRSSLIIPPFVGVWGKSWVSAGVFEDCLSAVLRAGGFLLCKEEEGAALNPWVFGIGKKDFKHVTQG